MKKINYYLRALFLVIAFPFSAAFAQDSFTSNVVSTGISENGANLFPAHLDLTIALPAGRESQIVRVDYENQSIFSWKRINQSPVFLFSVTRLTGDQWMSTKDQLKGYTILENKNGYITFVEKTNVSSIKGASESAYQQMLGEVDAMVNSIQLK